ncbi:hypothetical protein SAMN02910456_01473 [Ruminococcaceae bacterium YRB3002]|nr:hypothetical protein SAMN02910456_01473 [Ruminococcaceae bacterium YRB3002]
MRKCEFGVLLICGAVLLSGCSLLDQDKGVLELPPNPQSFEQIYEEDTGDTTISVSGRTYSYFGTVKDSFSNDSIRECLGYVDDDKNMRVYTLYDDPYDNYIMVRYINGIMEQPQFLRAVDTRMKDVFTPSYIESLGYECWGSSGLHYEMPAAYVRFVCNCENVKFIDYEVSINGEFAFTGETGYPSHKPVDKGEIFDLEINEWEAGDKAEKDEPFDVVITFVIIDPDDNTHEVEGSYEREMMFGATLVGLEIREENGKYYLYEDV